MYDNMKWHAKYILMNDVLHTCTFKSDKVQYDIKMSSSSSHFSWCHVESSSGGVGTANVNKKLDNIKVSQSSSIVKR